MSLSTLSASFKISVIGSASVDVTGYNPLAYPLSLAKQIGPFKATNANTASLGADQLYSALVGITSSGNTDIDLTDVTNYLQQSSEAFARVKGYLIRLLSETDDPDNGTACSAITLQATGSNLIVLPGLTGTLKNGDFLCWATADASGIAVDSTHKIIHVVNSDAANAAAVQVTIVGGDS